MRPLKKGEINLVFTNFKKEIALVNQKLEKNINLQKYFEHNHLFYLRKRLQKEEKCLKEWLNDLLNGQKEYFSLL
jgi:hypothetical protein